jgi:non-specific serine/threonine protein kinase/serine/threonine-protein kinase
MSDPRPHHPRPAPDAPTADLPAPAGRTPSGTPERIGPYVIREVIGEGGFGIVYAAEQFEPVRRRVALKVIKPGMDSRSVVARFEAERQALAVMDHPGVAKVFDGGTVPEGQPGAGRPFFVMEFVPGEPITAYADRRRLTIDQRVALFIQVCRAVQHAHTKAVIHRDLKPGNILVSEEDGEPRARVIDFGIAKALNRRLAEGTFYTERGQLIGTPEYMSPEQAEMSALDIDTRADVYSLGVVLYELLVGVRPFELGRAGFMEIQRTLLEAPPEKPSTRLRRLAEQDPELPARIASARRASARHLARELRGDLDAVIAVCLEKDRGDRYASVSELALDLQRYLEGEPVLSRPAGGLRQFIRFARRHDRWVSGVLLAVAVCLLLFAQVFLLASAVSILPEDPAYNEWIASTESDWYPPLESVQSVLLLIAVAGLFAPFAFMGVACLALAIIARSRAVRLRAALAALIGLGLPVLEMTAGIAWMNSIEDRTPATGEPGGE